MKNLLYKLSGLAAFDAETSSTLHPGCSVAEELAAIRYGNDWRLVYRAKRDAIRHTRWPLLARWIAYPYQNETTHETFENRT